MCNELKMSYLQIAAYRCRAKTLQSMCDFINI